MPAAAVRARRGQQRGHRARSGGALPRAARRRAGELLRAPLARLQPRSEGGAAKRAGLCRGAERRQSAAPDADRRAAAPGAAAAHQPHARRDRQHRGDATRAAGAHEPAARAAGGGGRFPAPAVELVQPGLPAAAARRLEFAGAAARADHPPRGSAPDRRLGRPASPPAARPPLLRLLPPAAARRAADLRRGGAAAGDARGHRSVDRQDLRARAGEPVQGGGVLFHQQLPAGAEGRVAGQLPDQARGRGAQARAAAAQDLLHALAHPRLRALGARRRAVRGAAEGARAALAEAHAALADACARDFDKLTHAATLKALPEPAAQALLRLAAYYLGCHAPSAGGDPVARFHLDNGARLERLNALGDLSAKGLRQSFGMMVNYLYDLDKVEAHHEKFVHGEVAQSRLLTSLL
ncbi:hypothetical protein FSC37_17065 [Piscinibacter aquaticus]|uniref:Malonyl-CoA decarboxylase C-terminal domain-containing protein n=1 Tax=Piscinibacter aquaticus TaxID=392597 RepID=A0A5C6U1M9_9BURK|nr:hypothetical protein FSC37_17065 [Piscinibacter aquaticus]